MAIDPVTGALIAQGVATGTRAISALLTPTPRRFSRTAAGRRLKEISEKGAISPRQRRLLAARASLPESDAAQRRRAAIAGRLGALGMERSIAGVRALGEPGRDVQRSRAAFGQELELLNLQSQQAAAAEFAEREAASVEVRRQARAGRTRALVEAVGGGIAGGIQGVLAGQDTKLKQDVLQQQLGLERTKAEAAARASDALVGLRGEQQRQIADAINASAEMRALFGPIDPNNLMSVAGRIIGTREATEDTRDLFVQFILSLIQAQGAE